MVFSLLDGRFVPLTLTAAGSAGRPDADFEGRLERGVGDRGGPGDDPEASTYAPDDQVLRPEGDERVQRVDLVGPGKRNQHLVDDPAEVTRLVGHGVLLGYGSPGYGAGSGRASSRKVP
jgi:hypothetical protein